MASEFSPPIDIAKEREMEVEGREQTEDAGTVPVRRRRMEVAVVGQEQWELIRSRGLNKPRPTFGMPLLAAVDASIKS